MVMLAAQYVHLARFTGDEGILFVGLLVLQILLAWTGGGVPYVFGGLHPLNAFVILGFLGSITYREWKGVRAASPEAAPATAAPPA